MKVRFHPRARAELYRAAEWYDARAYGLGDAFYAEVDAALALMREFPNAQSEVLPNWRRALLKRFPYGLIYCAFGPDTLLVIAVAHSRRRAGYWRRRKTISLNP